MGESISSHISWEELLLFKDVLSVSTLSLMTTWQLNWPEGIGLRIIMSIQKKMSVWRKLLGHPWIKRSLEFLAFWNFQMYGIDIFLLFYTKISLFYTKFSCSLGLIQWKILGSENTWEDSCHPDKCYRGYFAWWYLQITFYFITKLRPSPSQIRLSGLNLI